MQPSSSPENNTQFATHLDTTDRKPDRVLVGRHCEVRCYTLEEREEGLKVFFVPFWRRVGSDLLVATDNSWIAYAICGIPHVDYFINFRTFDQVHHWMDLKDDSVRLAQAFLSERGQSDDLHLQDLEMGIIDKFSYDYTWAAVGMYKALWKVLKGSGRKILTALKRCKSSYTFTSNRELFAEIMREVLEGEFLVCFKRRRLCNASQIDEIAKLKCKQHKTGLPEKEEKKLYSLIDRTVPFAKVYNNTLWLAQQLEKVDASIQPYLEEYYANLDRLSKLQIQRECKPKFRIHRQPSHTWEQGRYIEGLLKWDA